jgi:putative transposase
VGADLRDHRGTAQALLAFRQTYNTTWLIERHGFLTPAQFRQKQLQTAAIAA